MLFSRGIILNENRALFSLYPVFFDRARKQAKELDAEFAATGKLKGPLHGVPVRPATSSPLFAAL